MNILITGGAGFIGYHLGKSLAEDGHKILLIDNLSNNLLFSLLRLKNLGIFYKQNTTELIKSEIYENLDFLKIDILDKKIQDLIDFNNYDIVFHLAATTGISSSLENFDYYTQNNIIGFNNIINNLNTQKFIYASSSSVYGNMSVPFSEDNHNIFPISFYGITKRTNELISYLYSFSKNIQTIGLRFFTVYGPWGRPDMLIFKLIEHAFDDREITIYGSETCRDFTYISDVIDYMKLFINKEVDIYNIYNIGRGQPVSIKEIICIVEKKLKKKIKYRIEERKSYDMENTHADNSKIKNISLDKVFTDIENGIEKTIDWFLRNKLIEEDVGTGT